MTRQLHSTRRSTDAQPTESLHRRSTLSAELLALAATLAAALAAAWVLSQPLLGLATLTGLALLLPLAARLHPLTPSHRPTPLQWLAELAGQ